MFYFSGKSTGIITTTALTHATPSSTYAHVPYRWWYNDGNVPWKAKLLGCKDIAQQFYDNSHMITVIIILSVSGKIPSDPISLLETPQHM